MQTSFSDLEYAAKKKRTRRDLFLAEIKAVTSWRLHVLAIEPYYLKGEGRGPLPIGIERILRMYVAQQCFGLSNEGIENAIRRTVIWRAFHRFAILGTLTVTVMTGLLAGCTVGPNFTRPAPSEVKSYIPENAAPNLSPGAGEPSQLLIVNQAIPAAWWRMFRSPSLDNVVQQAIAASPTIEAAKAKLAQSQQAVLQVQGAYYPQIDAGASAERQKGPPFALGILPSHTIPTFNLYSVGATVSFDPDVFGLTTRLVEEQKALAENQAYQLAAAQLSVTGNAVNEVLLIASARLQIDAVNAIVTDDEKTLTLVRQKYNAGKVARTDTLTAEARLESDHALLPPLRQHVAVAEDALAILVGKSPSEWIPPAFDLADFTLPADLPVSMPSTLAQQRPDILAAEARLHAASAAVGVADAQMYPNFILSSSVGAAALNTNSLGDRSSLIWTLFGGLTAPIFHGGALTAQKQGAINQFHSELSLYRQTVLDGLGQVADLLRALDHDAELVQAKRRALDATGATLNLQRLSYASGKTSLLGLLDTEHSYQQTRLGYVLAEAQRYLDSAQLFVAMGGGWWEDPALCGDCRERLGLTDKNVPLPPSRDSAQGADSSVHNRFMNQ